MAERLLITQTYLAKLLGLTVRRVQQLIADGIISKYEIPPGTDFVKADAKKVDAQRAIEEYYAAKYCPEETKELRVVQAEHEAVKMQISKIKLARIEGKMHAAEDVERCMTDMLLTFRNRLLSMPQKVASKVIGIDNANEIADVIAAEISAALMELSDYRPELFAEGDGDDA